MPWDPSHHLRNVANNTFILYLNIVNCCLVACLLVILFSWYFPAVKRCLVACWRQLIPTAIALRWILECTFLHLYQFFIQIEMNYIFLHILCQFFHFLHFSPLFQFSFRLKWTKFQYGCKRWTCRQFCEWVLRVFLYILNVRLLFVCFLNNLAAGVS